MNRSLTLLVVVLACATFSPNASAAPREIPSGDFVGISVSDGFLYWAKAPTGCGGCQRIGRTSLASGAVEGLGQLPKNRDLFSLHAGGGRAVVGTLQGNRTAVYEFRADRARRRLVQRNWRADAKRACGAVVYAGAVSPAGEASWDLLTGDPPSKGAACSGGVLTNFVSRTFTQRAGRNSILHRPVWRGDVGQLTEALPKSSFSRTIALNSRHLLLARSETTAVLIDRKSGKRSTRPFLADSDPGGYGNVLANDGTTIGNEQATRSGYAFGRPVLATGGKRTRLEPYVAGNGSNAYFCGKRIVQVTSVFDPATDTSSIAVVLRDISGQPLLTLLAPGEADLGDFYDADCDAKTLVIQSANVPDENRGTGNGATGTGATGYFGPLRDDLAKTWAIDLP